MTMKSKFHAYRFIANRTYVLQDEILPLYLYCLAFIKVKNSEGFMEENSIYLEVPQRAMPLSVGLDRIPQTTVKEQEDGKEKEKESRRNENENTFMDCMDIRAEFESNEPELATFTDRNLKSYFRAGDAFYWEEEVKDMMENVKRVQEALSEAGKIEEVFRFRTEDFGHRKDIKNEDDLKILFQEIEKMDTILKVKVNEERKARLSRIQVEEESRNILTTLAFPKTSGGMKYNFDEFMKLLNEVDSMEHGPLVSCDAVEMNRIETDEHGEDDLKEKATRQRQKTNNLKFVERNIQLAKCGRGTLSLTDEEKSRIEGLLEEVEHSNSGRAEESEEAGDVPTTDKKPENEKTVYGLDDETKSILSQIDERLEMLSEVRRSMRWFNKNVKKVFEENEKGKREEKEERNRLKQINQLLNSVNSISGEEVYPLTDEELESLIRESKEALTEESPLEEGVQCSYITELVSSAKLLMPKFKYRYEEC